MAANDDSILSVLTPVTITDAMLISTTAPDDDYPAWAVGTTYAIGDRVVSTHRIYESAKATNLGKDPTLEINQTGTPAWWIDIGPMNKWAIFDGEASTPTTAPLTFTVVIEPGYFNSIYMAKIDAEQIEITVKDFSGGNIIYHYAGALESSAPSDYYEYFFDRFKPQTDFVVDGIDPYNDAEVTITFSRITGIVSVGVIAIGDLRPLGTTQWGAKASPRSYSYITTDDFGNTKIVRRKAVTDMTATAILDLVDATVTLNTIQELLDVPAVWIGSSILQYSGLRVYGLGSGDLTYDRYNQATLTLSVKGLI